MTKVVIDTPRTFKRILQRKFCNVIRLSNVPLFVVIYRRTVKNVEQ